MSIKDRRNKEKVELRKKILHCAFSIINNEGHNKLTIRRLADEIEYSPRTVYLYYANRDEILQAVVEYGYSFTLNNLKANDFYRGLSPQEHLKNAIENHIKMAFDNPNYYKAVVHVIQEKGMVPGPSQIEVEQYIANSIAGRCRRGSTDSLFTTFFLTSSLRGITIELLNRQQSAEEVDLNNIIEELYGYYSSILF